MIARRTLIGELYEKEATLTTSEERKKARRDSWWLALLSSLMRT